jgi:uncharacterized glyoxalase superfamily protein PhnB
MKLTTLQPFVPSGKDFGAAKRFFQELGFEVKWEAPGYAGLALGNAAFILQAIENRELQDNFMLLVDVDDLDAWWRHIQESGVLERHPGVHAKPPTDYPWGNREVHLVDVAGVCWHFR